MKNELKTKFVTAARKVLSGASSSALSFSNKDDKNVAKKEEQN